MADSDEFQSDEELDQATKDGTIREGTARIHHKLFQKYGFLMPENPTSVGETIFFGLTAHVDASKRFIADLRDELKPDQRVQYMAVPVQKDGVLKWKALVVSPLPSGSQNSSEELIEENHQWLTCRILPSLQPNRGFATPEGGDQYADNVYFTTSEASIGLETRVTDLKLFFKPWEVIKALVVLAGPRYKAKYRAIKVCKVSPENGVAPNNQPEALNEDSILVKEMDQGAVSWMYSVLKAKGSVKVSKLVGNLSNHSEVRVVVQPQKKSLRKFLSKYSQFFRIKDNIVSLDPNCPPLHFNSKVEGSLKSINEKNWSGSSDSEESSSEEEARKSAPSPVPYSTQNLKSVAQVLSKFTSSMLASIVKSVSEPVKMAEIFKMCGQNGWDGMLSVAMVAQVVSNNPKYFAQDERGCVILTSEGNKLSVKRIERESSKIKDAAFEENPSASRVSPTTQGNLLYTPLGSAHSDFSPLSSADSQQFSASGFDTNLSASTYSYPNADHGFFSPISNDSLDPSAFKPYNPSGLSSADNIFPTSSVLLSTKTGDTNFGDGYVYESDGEESTEEKHKISNKSLSTRHYTDEENRFLSVVARGICSNSANGAEIIFKMLLKGLDTLGITQGDADSYRLSGVLSRHLLCIQMDIGAKPRAKFKHFTPSGKITETTVTLSAENVSLKSLKTMLKTGQSIISITKVGKLLHGIEKTYHCIRVLTDGLDEDIGCTISFNTRDASNARLLDVLEFRERKKIKILLTNTNVGANSSDACATLKKYALEKSTKSTVAVIDMEGQIFGYGLATPNVRRMLCSDLDTQQNRLKEVFHHHPDFVVANAIDCEDSLKLLQRISFKGVAIYAEVAKSLEGNVRNIFEA